MVSKNRVVLHNEGFDKLRKLPAIQQDLKRRADKIAAAAGEGFVAEAVFEGSRRARVQVYSDTYKAKLAEANEGALTRAIDAGRT